MTIAVYIIMYMYGAITRSVVNGTILHLKGIRAQNNNICSHTNNTPSQARICRDIKNK